jgi:hypothetical protein
MNRRRFLALMGLGAVTPVANKVIPPEPEVIERDVITDKLVEWNTPGGVFYNPKLGKYVELKEVE